MPYEHPPQGDVCRGSHVPHGDGAVFGTRHHHAVVEAEVQHGFAVVDQCIQHLACIHVPHSAGSDFKPERRELKTCTVHFLQSERGTGRGN